MPAADPTYEGQARVYRKQGATAMVIASGGTLEVQPGGTINLSSGSITMPTNLAVGYRPLDIFAARVLTSAEQFIGVNFSGSGISLGSSVGGLLNAGSVPTLTMNSSLNQAAVLTWASGQTAAIAFPPIGIPPDFSSAGGLEVHLHGSRTSDGASNNAFDVRFWANANTSNKGSSCTTLTTSPTEKFVAISSAEVGAHPGYWNIGIQPGTHTNNAVKLWSAWLEYTKRTS